MDLIFWQDILSFHQSAHIRCLSLQGHRVTLIVEQDLSPDRRVMGWHLPDFGETQLIIGPSDSEVVQIVAASRAEAIHVVGGVRGYHIGKVALETCIEYQSRVGLLTESGDPRPVKGFLRRMLYVTERYRFGRHLDFILAMGELGVRWFRAAGYPSSMIFPCAYTTETPSSPIHQLSPSVERCLLFIGQCIERKGVDILIHALAAIGYQNWKLILVGEGPKRVEWEALAERLGIKLKMHFLPFTSNEKVHELLADADMLILPSRFDGWGAVVNEALMAGVPVICSDMCGAADLLRFDWLGETFKAGSVSELATTIQRHLLEPRKTTAETHAIVSWARKSIHGEAVARYMSQVFAHVYGSAPRPIPPWHQ